MELLDEDAGRGFGDVNAWGSDQGEATTDIHVSPSVRAAVYKLHVNTGHRFPGRLGSGSSCLWSLPFWRLSN